MSDEANRPEDEVEAHGPVAEGPVAEGPVAEVPSPSGTTTSSRTSRLTGQWQRVRSLKAPSPKDRLRSNDSG